jgi:restriction system protein
MKNYVRVMLGKKSIHAPECFAGGYIGGDFGIAQDLTGRLPDEWRPFNKEFIPVFLAAHPEKTKVAAGLSCGFLWTICKGLKKGDWVLCPDGEGSYRVGEIISDYDYVPGGNLPHRRKVQWLEPSIQRSDMSQGLRNSTGAIGTVSTVSQYAEEIDKLMSGSSLAPATEDGSTVEDQATFVLEKHLETFLVENWKNTDLGRDFSILEEDGEIVGQQYPTDTGPIDILAVSKDKKRLLVVELKKGRASDAVVGQIARYMGYVQEELAEDGQTVEGVIIALEDDLRIRRALSVMKGVRFYRYQISFKLVPHS